MRANEREESRRGEPELAPLSPAAVRVERAADRMGVSRAHLYRLIAGGELRTVKSGARRLVPLASITEYLARSSESP